LKKNSLNNSTQKLGVRKVNLKDSQEVAVGLVSHQILWQENHSDIYKKMQVPYLKTDFLQQEGRNNWADSYDRTLYLSFHHNLTEKKK
jgi:hypothetical protein